MRLHELEDLGIASVSRANQVAAFARISRSVRNCLFLQRNRFSSSRSALARPSSPRPSFRSAWRTQLWIV